jgi:hypothetical protein
MQNIENTEGGIFTAKIVKEPFFSLYRSSAVLAFCHVVIKVSDS